MRNTDASSQLVPSCCIRRRKGTRRFARWDSFRLGQSCTTSSMTSSMMMWGGASLLHLAGFFHVGKVITSVVTVHVGKTEMSKPVVTL